MKTSNKLILAAFLIAFTSLVIYNYQLKAIYTSKNYLNPLNDFTELGFRDFKVIDVTASGVGNVKIVQGPWRVMVRKQDSFFIRLNQQNGHLQVNASFAAHKPFADRNYDGFRVYISCPNVSAINFDNQYLVDGKPWKDSTARQYWNRQNTISGFHADSLVLRIDNGSYVLLDSNNLRSLSATAGPSKGSRPILELANTNKIASANLDLENGSSLNLYCIIPNLEYHISDSSTLHTAGYVGTSLGKK